MMERHAFKWWGRTLNFLVGRRFLLCVALLAACACQSVPVATPAPSESKPVPSASPRTEPVTMQGEKFQLPSRLPDASLVPITFRFDPTKERPESCVAKIGPKSFEFYAAGAGRWETLGVVGYLERGPQRVDLKCTVYVTLPTGEAEKRVEVAQYTITVEPREYSKEALRVDPSKVNPSKKDLIRIQRDIKKVGAIYRDHSKERFWTGPWKRPVAGPQTSPYGNQRTFNGEMRSSHQGIDFRAPTGTEIFAPAGARVALAEDLFFTGNTVILDHGFGLYTVFAHLSKLEIQVGEQVSAGTRLGLSGATGRASGPHLHLGAVLHGVKFNPEELFEVLR